jgi:CDP-diacylglycerol--serine O-phosphatidyltransferase
MGFLAILWSIRGFHASMIDPSSAAVYFDQAAIAMGLAILFDTMDGRLARATRTATEIGVQFDSLADVMTFGIAPTALIYGWAVAPTFAEGTPPYNIGVILLFVYLMCGAFRLARFNLAAMRPHVNEDGDGKVDKKSFVGLPIPPAAGLLAAIVHYSPAPLNFYSIVISQYYAVFIYLLLGILSVLMVSKVGYSSFKSAGAVRMNFLVLVLIAAFGMLMWFYSQYALLAISIIYVSHGIIGWLYRAATRRKSDTTPFAEEAESN